MLVSSGGVLAYLELVNHLGVALQVLGDERLFAKYDKCELRVIRRWLELIKNYEISMYYHPSKTNIMVSAQNRVPMSSVAYVDEGGKGVTREVHRLAGLGVRLEENEHGGIVFMMVPNLLWLKRSRLSKTLILPY